MNKKITLIVLIVTFIISSLLAVFSTDMFLGVVVNAGAKKMIFATLTTLFLSVDLVIVFLGTIRIYLRPNTRKKAFKLYTLLITIFSGLGFVMAILSGIIEYHSLVKPYPFPGFHLIFMIAHLLIALCGAYGLIFCLKKMKDDEDTFKVTAKHVFKTIGWFLFICLTMNRFGNFLLSPFFIQWRLFGLTFVFYIFLLVPLCLGVFKVLKLLGIINCPKFELIFSICMEVVTIGLAVTIIILGSTHSEFVSSVSHAMGLERISSKPFEIIIHFASYVAVATILLVQSLPKKAKVEEKPVEE